MVTATAEKMDLPVVQEVAHAELDRQFPGEKITLRQLIVGVADLLDDPAHWTTGALAKDANGNSVGPTDPTATCWCAIGATYKVYYDLTGTKVFDTGKQERLVLKITQRLMQSASQMLVGKRVEGMNDAKDGAENLRRVMPLALSIIEYAVENQQGALGEALGSQSIVDPVMQEDEHEHVQDLPSQNGGDTALPQPEEEAVEHPVEHEAGEKSADLGVAPLDPSAGQPASGQASAPPSAATAESSSTATNPQGWDESATGTTDASTGTL